MENLSNLSVLLNILFNGMMTVFLVLFLVYLIGKIIIYFVDSSPIASSKNNINNDSDIKNIIHQKIKDIAGKDAEIISYRKLD
ncbi:MAG: hypothetical protein CL869_04485 [Cytophagia bacterium]|nr:hypothetical protein [Cytophagia bacterium]